MKKFLQKLLVAALIVSSTVAALVPVTSVSATNGAEVMGDFLGLVRWDNGVDTNPQDDVALNSMIWGIVSNVATDLAIIASYLVIGYVIWGGYQYMLSNGDPAKVASGKKTLVHAFIGLAITMLASVIMSSIRIALTGSTGQLNPDSSTDVTAMVFSLIDWVTSVAGIVAAVFVVIGGISYMTSAGDAGKLAKAKQTILYSLIGLAIVGLTMVITGFVSSTIRESAYLQNNNIAINLITNKGA